MTKSKNLPYVQRDPTLTETVRLVWAKKLKALYRNYSYDIKNEVIKDIPLTTLLKSIDGFTAKTNLQGELLSYEMTTDAYLKGLVRADVISQSILGKEVIGTIGISKGMIGPANIEVIKILDQRSIASIHGLSSELEKKVKFNITQGIIEGKGAKALAKDVSKVIHNDLWKAERIVRTEFISTTNTAAVNRYVDYGFTHYSISVEEWCDSSGNCCKICPNARDNGPYKFGEGPVPPLHVNCRCSIYPVEHKEVGKIPEKQITQKSLYKKIAKSEETFKYNDFETAKFYNPVTGKVLKSFKGNKDSVSFGTHLRGDAMKGQIMSHNHPGGASFSAQDIYHLSQIKESELRACTPSRTYSIKVKNAEGWKELVDYDKDFGIIKAHNALREDHKKLYWDAVKTGKMDAIDANIKTYHGVNKDFFKNFKNIDYIVEETT